MMTEMAASEHRIRNPAKRRTALFDVLLVSSVIFSTAVSSSATPGLADDSETKFFNGLRDRRLFELAETHCLDELQNKSIKPARRTELTLELSRTYVEHAQFVSIKDQPEVWTQATSVIDDLLKAKDVSKRKLLQIQRALVSSRRCAFLRAHCDLFTADQDARRQGLAVGQDAIGRFREIESRLNAKSISAKSTTELTPDERRQLLRNVRLESGQVSIEMAQMLPVKSPDRAEALLNAEEWLKQLDRRPSVDDIAWRARVSLAVASRLQGDLAGASREVASMMSDKPSSKAVVERVVAEHVRLLLLTDKLEDAGQFLVEYRRNAGRFSGELHLLLVETLMRLRALVAKQGSKSLTEQFDDQLAKAVLRVDQEVGGYWSTRCRVVVDRLNESNELGADVAKLMQDARSLFLAGRNIEAAKGYLKAAAESAKNSDAKSAADFRFTAASILLKAEEHQQAAKVFGIFANAHDKDERAPKAHLLHTWSLGQVFNGQRTTVNREAYTTALLDHRKRYPQTDGFGDATWMLGQLQEQRRQATKALELYLQVPADHRYGKDAQVGVARTYKTIFQRLTKLNFPAEEVTKWQQKATQHLGGIVRSIPNDSRITIDQAEVLSSVASVLLAFSKPDYNLADSLLDRAIRATEAPVLSAVVKQEQRRKKVLNSARQVRVLALAGRGNTPQASVLMNQVATDDSASFVQLVDGLSKLAEQQSNIMAFEIGSLQLKAIDRLMADENKDIDVETLKRMKVDALISTGKNFDAIRLLQEMVSQSPKNKKLLEQLAIAQEATAQNEMVKEAYEIWKRIEGSFKPGSNDWCRARYQVARTGLKLGYVAQTRKLLKVTKLLYPEMGGPELSGQFSKLQQTIDQ